MILINDNWHTELLCQVPLNVRFYAQRVNPKRYHIWHIAAPKSGSTWLTSILSYIFTSAGFKIAYLHNARMREQEIIPHILFSNPNDNIFSPHQHCKYSEYTIDLISLFRIRPILSIRNIFDTVISMRDHIINGTYESVTIPTFHLSQTLYNDFSGWSIEKQLDTIIDLCIPWFFHFYSGWFGFQHPTIPNGEIFYVPYEDLRADTVKVVIDLLAHCGMGISTDEVKNSVENIKQHYTRKNKAEIGRGKILLNDRHKEQIFRMASYYRDIDFSPIGIYV